MVTDANGTASANSFYSKCKPTMGVGFSEKIHGISNAMLKNEKLFDVVGQEFMNWVDVNTKDDSTVCLVAYNGATFDFPFLLACLERYNISVSKKIKYTLDPLKIIRNIPWDPIPCNKKLSTMFKYVTNAPLANAHSASADVQAMVTILRHTLVWEKRLNYFEMLDDNKNNKKNKTTTIELTTTALTTTASPPPVVAVEDSHHLVEFDDFSDEEEFVEEDLDVEERILQEQEEEQEKEQEEEEGQDTAQTPNIVKTGTNTPIDTSINDGWSAGVPYLHTDVDHQNDFQKVLKDQVPSPIKTRGDEERRVHRRMGPQLPPSRTSTPLKAWREIFHSPIKKIIIINTNEYGMKTQHNWVNIDEPELLDFFSILFIAAVQKRKDGPHQWFSDNVVLGDACIRRLMKKKRFLQILKGLSISSLNNPRGHEPGYHPNMKVLEFKSLLEKRFRALYEPGRNLSVDETLLRAYGRISFKVRVVTKSARYGIKMYVCTDAVDEYILCTSMYTGGDREDEMTETNLKKTTKVVLDLVNNYKGTYRGVKTDRFYTSVELTIELEKIQISTTGTIMKNRIPKELRWNAKKARKMERGQFENHLYKYRSEHGGIKQMGLIIWKDRKPVYVLTNETSTLKVDACVRRSKQGLLTIPRPNAITIYNRDMGGVDISDQKRLFCESRVHGLKRWWVRVFLYHMDAGAVNASVLVRHSRKILNIKNDVKNMRDFKVSWLNDYCGTRIGTVVDSTILSALPTCHLVQMTRRNRCAWCNMIGDRSDSWLSCRGCVVSQDRPIYFCNPAVRKCFFLAHNNEITRLHVLANENASL